MWPDDLFPCPNACDPLDAKGVGVILWMPRVWRCGLTEQGTVVDPLLHLGLLHQNHSGAGQQELPRPRPETVSVIFNDGRTMLRKGDRGREKDGKKITV